MNTIYRWIWRHIGGRPWTYITRDLYHKAEYFVLMGTFVAGYFLGRAELLTWKTFLLIMLAYTIGFLHGHFFWGTEYRENQGGDE